MALQVPVDQSTGVTVAYWRITELHVNLANNYSTVILSGYLSKDCRTAGKDPLASKLFRWTSEDNPVSKTVLESGNSLSVAYVKIKETEPYTEAQDV